MEQHYVGIDVAKDSFVAFFNNKTQEFKNTKKGINSFIKHLPNNSWCIMEATGNYSVRLALALYDKNIRVSVVNPLQIKRFSQTKLSRTKTDHVDAKIIAEYGLRMQPDDYCPEPDFIRYLKQKRTILKRLIKTRTAYSNQIHALQQLPDTDKEALKACKKLIKITAEQIQLLEKSMANIIEKYCQKEFLALKSIAGIGEKSAIEIIIVSGLFYNFSSAKQFIAFIGACPSINQSGTSISKVKGISKVGQSYTRSLLYMAALTAITKNKPCQVFYQRLIEKGKPKKVAIIAVMNKLIKQAFAIVKSGEPFNPDFQPKFS